MLHVKLQHAKNRLVLFIRYVDSRRRSESSVGINLKRILPPRMQANHCCKGFKLQEHNTCAVQDRCTVIHKSCTRHAQVIHMSCTSSAGHKQVIQYTSYASHIQYMSCLSHTQVMQVMHQLGASYSMHMSCTSHAQVMRKLCKEYMMHK